MKNGSHMTFLAKKSHKWHKYKCHQSCCNGLASFANHLTYKQVNYIAKLSNNLENIVSMAQIQYPGPIPK